MEPKVTKGKGAILVYTYYGKMNKKRSRILCMNPIQQHED